MRYDRMIIGGGAAGLMLAARLDLNRISGVSGSGSPSSHACTGLILEKTPRIGTKLLMSGGGRCNITHGGSVKDFVGCYGASGRYLRRCLYRHSNIELASWLEENGISLADEQGSPVSSRDLSAAGRIFPASMKASDILDLLKEKALKNGWEIRTGSEVCGIRQLEGAMSLPQESDCRWAVRTSGGEEYLTHDLIIASGGITFPETGSDGSLFDILRDAGVRIVTPRSALAPVYVNDYPYEELSGISIPGVTVTASIPSGDRSQMKKTACMTGDLLFTHRGFSGPVILNISGHVHAGSLIRISYGKSAEDLPKRLLRLLEDRSRGPSGDIRTTVLSALLASDDFTVSAVDGNGMVTAGGISLDEIDMQTMQLRSFPGLYAIGEAIDADGITGGYNLQMCWSTASTAAQALSQS